MDVPNTDLFDTSLNGKQWSKSNSPWSNPQLNCYWPVDTIEKKLCSLSIIASTKGLHQCYHDVEFIPSSQWTWCGSDFDAFGNYRFLRPFGQYDFTIYQQSTNFGYTNFDNIGTAMISIFQCLTGIYQV